MTLQTRIFDMDRTMIDAASHGLELMEFIFFGDMTCCN